jgi:hypothetical protein
MIAGTLMDATKSGDQKEENQNLSSSARLPGSGRVVGQGQTLEASHMT